MSKAQRPEEGRGASDKLRRFFKFGNNVPPEEKMLNTFKEDFSKTENGVIVITLGPSRCGKSTLLNFLTVKDYPLLNERGRITKEAKEMMYFKAQSGEEPCTADFNYKKIKASELMVIHGLELPYNFVDYDIFFIDTEGFSTIKGVSQDLFLGIFTLLSGVSTQIYLDITPMSNADRVKSIAQNIAVSRFLGSELPQTISISRGGALANNNEDGDDDDDATYNDKLYKEYRERDKKNKPVFISALKEKVVVDEDKVEILTIPRCDVINGIAYKNTVKDLAKMILNCATPCNGKVLLDKIEDSYNKVCNCSESLTGQITLGDIYVNILKDYCIREIEKEEKNVENEFKELADNKSYDEVMKIRSGKDSSVNALFGEPYSRFMKSFEKIIPKADALDGMTVEFLKKQRERVKRKNEEDHYRFLSFVVHKNERL